MAGCAGQPGARQDIAGSFLLQLSTIENIVPGFIWWHGCLIRQGKFTVKKNGVWEKQMNLSCYHLFYYPQFSGNRDMSSLLILKWWGLLEPQKQFSGRKMISKKLGFDKYTCDKLHLQGEITEFHLVSFRDSFKDQKHFKYACLRKFLKQFCFPLRVVLCCLFMEGLI